MYWLTYRVGRKRSWEGCRLPQERGRGTMAASWPGGIVASMAGGRDGEGGTGSGCGATDCMFARHGFVVVMF
jgi:hypothetical protein